MKSSSDARLVKLLTELSAHRKLSFIENQLLGEAKLRINSKSKPEMFTKAQVKEAILLGFNKGNQRIVIYESDYTDILNKI